MEATASASPVNTDLDKTTRVPIASLDPSRPPPADTSISAVVSLVWPYSSSHRTFALLLAEPDFRLRRNRGQIRIQLKGHIAEALAESHVGIGDYLRLSLEGSQWVEDAATVKTPGRSVDANLLFKSRILLQFEKDGKLQPTLYLDHAESPPPRSPSPREVTPQAPSTPIPEAPQSEDLSRAWRTPAHIRSSLEANHPISSSSYDLFGDDDAFAERPSKRTKFWRGSSHWRLVDRDSTSPDEGGSKSPKPVMPQLDGHAELIHNDVEAIEFGTHLLDMPQSMSAGMDHTKGPEHVSATAKESHVPLVYPDITSSQIIAPELPQIQTDMDVRPDQWTHQTSTGIWSSPSAPTLEPLPSAVLPQVSPLTSFQDSYFPRQLEQFGEPQIPDVPNDEDVISVFPIDPPQAISGEEMRLGVEDEMLVQVPEVVLDPPDDGIAMSQPNEPVINDLEAVDSLKMPQPETILPAQKQDLDFRIADQTYTADLILDQSSHMPPFMATSLDPVQSMSASEAIPQILVPVGDIQPPTSDHTVPGQYDEELEDLYGRPEPVKDVSESLPVAEEPLPLAPEKGLLVPEPLTPDASQEAPSQTLPLASLGHRVDEILDGRLPPTPQPSDIQSHMTDLSESVNTARKSQEEDHTTKLLRSSRKSSSFRTTEVPNAISTWFTTRRQSTEANDNENQVNNDNQEASSTKPSCSNQAVGFDFGSPSRRDHQSKTEPMGDLSSSAVFGGLRTPLSYYSPLSSLDRHINDSSQVGENLIDVIVVASSPTAKPERAKSGPKDFFTSLSVTDGSSFPGTLQVQIFRPFKMSLPRTDTGDVILFRNFSVKSRGGKCFLLSGESSAWYVWRYSQAVKTSGNEDMPIWARSTQNRHEARDDEEECNGPPVELGREERQYSLAMRYWWETLKRQGLVADIDLTNSHDAIVVSSGQKGPSSEGIAVGT